MNFHEFVAAYCNHFLSENAIFLDRKCPKITTVHQKCVKWCTDKEWRHTGVDILNCCLHHSLLSIAWILPILVLKMLKNWFTDWHTLETKETKFFLLQIKYVENYRQKYFSVFALLIYRQQLTWQMWTKNISIILRYSVRTTSVVHIRWK